MPDKLSIPDDPLTQEDARSIVENDPEFARLVAMELRKAEGKKPRRRKIKEPQIVKRHTFAPMVPPKLMFFDNRKVNATAKVVYVAMLTHARGNAICMVAQSTLATELGLSLDTIQRAMTALETHGFIRTNEDAYASQDSYSLLVRVQKKSEKLDDE